MRDPDRWHIRRQVTAAYDRAAAVYDDWHWRRIWDRQEAPRIAALLATTPVRRALDAGCGTGRYRDLLLATGACCVGLDPSAAMLERARGKPPGTRPWRLVRAALEALCFADDAFDVVLTARVLSHCPDLERVLDEIARVLAPGALLVYSDVHPDYPYQRTRVHHGDVDETMETAKHPLEVTRRALEARGFQEISVQSFTASDLTTEDRRVVLGRIEELTTPIGFVLAARRGRTAGESRSRLQDAAARIHPGFGRGRTGQMR